MEWISVNDKLPDNIDNVLCYNPSMLKDTKFEICYYDIDSKNWSGSSSIFLKGITHWAIPEQP